MVFMLFVMDALDDTWPKMAKGEHLLEQLISEQQAINPEHIFAMMKDQTHRPLTTCLPENRCWHRMGTIACRVFSFNQLNMAHAQQQ